MAEEKKASKPAKEEKKDKAESVEKSAEKTEVTEKQEEKKESVDSGSERSKKPDSRRKRSSRYSARNDDNAVDLESWIPKTEIGKKVKSGEITTMDEILDSGRRILEPEITDKLLPDLETDLLAIGQSKGKFGGGQRRVFRQTQKKTREGNKPKFSAYAVCGNRDGFVGFGYGKAKETVPAREKAFRQCKISLIKIRRACASWECTCNTPHTIPFKVTGKCGSVEVTLMPAPKGTGLCAEKEMAKILRLAGIKDIWSKTKGKTRTKVNHIKACIDALLKLTSTKIKHDDIKKMNIVEGAVSK